MIYNLIHNGTGYTDKLNVIYDLITKHGAKKIGNIPQEIVENIKACDCTLVSSKINGAKDFKIDAKEHENISFNLFEPINKEKIIEHSKAILNLPQNIIPEVTLQFRFLNHLGDKFEIGEAFQKTLPKDEQEKLLKKCLDFLNKNYADKNVFIMTDSKIFHNELKKYNNFILSNAAKTHIPSENAFLNLLSEIYVASNTDAYLCICKGLYKSRMLKYLPQIFNKNYKFKIVNI